MEESNSRIKIAKLEKKTKIWMLAEGKMVVYLIEELAMLEKRGVSLAKVHTNSFCTVLSLLEGGAV